MFAWRIELCHFYPSELPLGTLPSRYWVQTSTTPLSFCVSRRPSAALCPFPTTAQGGAEGGRGGAGAAADGRAHGHRLRHGRPPRCANPLLGSSPLLHWWRAAGEWLAGVSEPFVLSSFSRGVANPCFPGYTLNLSAWQILQFCFIVLFCVVLGCGCLPFSFVVPPSAIASPQGCSSSATSLPAAPSNAASNGDDFFVINLAEIVLSQTWF